MGLATGQAFLAFAASSPMTVAHANSVNAALFPRRFSLRQSSNRLVTPLSDAQTQKKPRSDRRAFCLIAAVVTLIPLGRRM
jgi:hypothetical protein